MTRERSVLIGIVILLLAIIVACFLILAYAGSDEEESNKSSNRETLEESVTRMRDENKAQNQLNEELLKYIAEEDKATGRKPLIERLDKRGLQD